MLLDDSYEGCIFAISQLDSLVGGFALQGHDTCSFATPAEFCTRTFICLRGIFYHAATKNNIIMYVKRLQSYMDAELMTLLLALACLAVDIFFF